jgi:hypothetical protein
MFFTPDGGLIGALFCPAGDWKMATIAEFLLIRLFADFSAHFLRLSGKLCRFLHFRAAPTHLLFIGVMCDFDAMPAARRDTGGRGAGLVFCRQAGAGQSAALNNPFVFIGFNSSTALIARHRRQCTAYRKN